MTRQLLAFMLALVVGLAPASALAGVQAPIDQAGWSARKVPITLPNGVKLAFVELGDPKGEPLLMLHGFTDSSRTWSLIAPYLTNYRLIIPDQRGHGAADAPACCYAPSNYADDARQLMDALGIEKFAVAGHSMGSFVAMTMAAEYPGRVTRVVLIGSTALVPVKRGGWLYDNVMALRFPIDPKSDFMREWHPANQPTPIDATFAHFAMQEILEVPEQVWRGIMRELVETPAGRQAADIKAPVLILSGGKDPLFPREHHEALVASFPGSEAHMFPNLGHNPLWEDPETLGDLIVAFLSKRDPRGDQPPRH